MFYGLGFDYLYFLYLNATMPGLADISQKIESLRRLSDKEVVYMDRLNIINGRSSPFLQNNPFTSMVVFAQDLEVNPG